jgi:Flp pilus assembly protein TadG
VPPSLVGARLRPAEESGAAILEFAFVVVIFVFFLYGLIAFGVILAQKQAITNAAADGARSAVGAIDDGAAQSAADARVVDALGAPDGRYSSTYSFSPCAGTHRCITVQITWDYENHPLVPPAPGLGVVTPDTFGAKAVVQYS